MTDGSAAEFLVGRHRVPGRCTYVPDSDGVRNPRLDRRPRFHGPRANTLSGAGRRLRLQWVLRRLRCVAAGLHWFAARYPGRRLPGPGVSLRVRLWVWLRRAVLSGLRLLARSAPDLQLDGLAHELGSKVHVASLRSADAAARRPWGDRIDPKRISSSPWPSRRSSVTTRSRRSPRTGSVASLNRWQPVRRGSSSTLPRSAPRNPGGRPRGSGLARSRCPAARSRWSP